MDEVIKRLRELQQQGFYGEVSIKWEHGIPKVMRETQTRLVNGKSTESNRGDYGAKES